MIITIFGASGQVGRQLIRHAIANGHFVKAFGRNIVSLIDEDLNSDQFEAIKGYVFSDADLNNALKGSDGVLSALGGGFDGADNARSLGMKKIVGEMENLGIKRIVALGGKGVLPGKHKDYLMDEDDYPAEFIPVGNEHRQAFLHLKNSNLDWTFVCAPDLVDGNANEAYTTMPEQAPPGQQITTGNLAHFMVQEIAKDHYLKHRVGIADL